jgi:hypothetical protein
MPKVIKCCHITFPHLGTFIEAMNEITTISQMCALVKKIQTTNSLQLLHTPNIVNIGVRNARGGGSWTTNETKCRMKQPICGKNMSRWYRKAIEWHHVQKLISWNQLGFRRKYLI